MAQLSPLYLACMLVTLSNGQVPFSEDCCTKKMVGGVGYTQVAGSTDGYDCIGQCVYEEDGKPGSRTCFKSGGSAPLPVKCTESFIGSAYVPLARNSGDVTFKTEIGTFSCTVGSATTEGENIECSEQVDQEAGSTPGSEEAAFFYSKSPDGKYEWMCFHTKDEGIHCDFDDTWICHFLPSYVGEHDVLFVEGAQFIEGYLLKDQIHNCQALCNNNATCLFWTLSFTRIMTEPNEHEHRNHRGSSECGIRNYDPNVILPNINEDQFTGKKNETKVYNGSVFVYSFNTSPSARECQKNCIDQNLNPNLPNCTTWTWQPKDDRSGSVCAINVYKPIWKIDISMRFPNPHLISGCIPINGHPCPTKPY